MELNSQRTGLGHQHGRRSIVLEHQYGPRDVMCKHSISKATTFHGHHAFLHCTTSTWKCLISRFVENVNARQRFLFFPWTSIQSFRIQLQKQLPTFDELNEME